MRQRGCAESGAPPLRLFWCLDQVGTGGWAGAATRGIGAAGAVGATFTFIRGIDPGAAGAPGGAALRHRIPPGIFMCVRAGTVHDTVLFFFIRMISNLATSPLS